MYPEEITPNRYGSEKEDDAMNIALPLISIYGCMQKYFMEGVSAGSVKE